MSKIIPTNSEIEEKIKSYSYDTKEKIDRVRCYYENAELLDEMIIESNSEEELLKKMNGKWSFYEWLSGDDYDDIANGTWTYLIDENRRPIGFINPATGVIKYFNDKGVIEDEENKK